MSAFRSWLHVPTLQVFLLIDSSMFAGWYLFDLLWRKVSIQGKQMSGVSGTFTFISCKTVVQGIIVGSLVPVRVNLIAASL